MLFPWILLCNKNGLEFFFNWNFLACLHELTSTLRLFSVHGQIGLAYIKIHVPHADINYVNFGVRGTRTQPLIFVGCSVHYWVPCAINKGGFFEIAFVFVVGTHLPRFEAFAYVWHHFDALTHLVIRVSSAFIFQTFAEVCYSVFVNRSSFKSVLNFRKAYIFKSLLKVYYRSVFNESSKAFIFQKGAESLHHD